MITPKLSEEKLYRYNVVTDPDDISVMEDLEKLLTLTETKGSLLDETNLDRGLVMYDILFYDHDATVKKLIDKISYVPVTVTLDLSSFEKYDHIGPVVSGAQSVVKALTEELLSTDIDIVETTTFENVIVLNPITMEGTSVYQNRDYLSHYHEIVNLDLIGGYQVLSTDPLTRYVLEDLYNQAEYVPEDIDVIYVEQIALIPVGTNDNEVDHYSSIVNRVNSIILSRRSEGYFTYKIGVQNMDDYELVQELSLLWDTEIISDQDFSRLVLKSDVNFGTSPEYWYGQNVNLIRKGHFPQITLFGPWQFNLGGDYNDIFGKSWYKIILQYAALLAYSKLGQDKLIAPFTHLTQVNEDYSITIYVPTYNYVVKYKQYLNEVLQGYQGETGEQNWSVQPCKSLQDGVYKRIYVQNIDPRSMPMVLENNGEELLVFRSPGLSEYNSSLDNIPNKIVDKVETSSRNKNVEWGYRGLYTITFDNKVVKGLYDSIPGKEFISPKNGIISITKIGNNELSGDIYLVTVTFSDNSSSDLFEIATQNKEELDKILPNLWQNGKLLTHWTSALEKYSNLQSYYVNVNNPLLIRAADSKIDGIRATEYLICL